MVFKMKNRINLIIILFLIFTLGLFSYVGPGAGFAFAGSFLFIFIAFFVALFNFLTFPIRLLIRFIKRFKYAKRAKFKRVIVIGFDGMDYNLVNEFKKQGKNLPNFEKIEKQGVFSPLWSTEPPISPVAWSTFSTGVNPGKHNIFDFLTTDRNTYMPKLACADIKPPKRVLNIGKFSIPISKPIIELLRKSKSFWKIVSSKGFFSSVLRVPFTFPPEKFYGVMLAGLGTPDLRGTQGSFSFYSDVDSSEFDISEGVFEKLEKVSDNKYKSRIKGPANPFVKGNPPIYLYFELEMKNDSAIVKFGKEEVKLEKGKLSDWIRLEFKVGFIKIKGVVQLVLEDTKPIRLYVSPINIDPEDPSMPVSSPKIFSVYLSKLLGPYATLGMAEDTWAVNEKVLSEKAFIQQVYKTQEERENIFFDTFKKQKNGLIVQVFESTDRIQHMFWRYFDDAKSPAEKPMINDEEVKDAIYKIYLKMDNFLERLLKKLNKNDLLIIVSDHGFGKFNIGFNLNTWLYKEGYIVLKEGKKMSDKWYADVDWSKTRAYGQGLNGIFLNMKGREKYGIVSPGKEAEKIKQEIKEKLMNVVDPKTGEKPVKVAFKREEVYKGPYTVNAPDVVVGYNVGYRVSWESAVNFIGNELFTDNTRMWSGDHAFTRDVVPGIFYCNRKINEKTTNIIDIAPTIISVFGINPPKFIDGKNLGVMEN